MTTDTDRPLAIDLFCGLGGWTDGLLAEGWRVVGFDIEQHAYGDARYPGQLVLQDVLTIDGAQFRNADLIVASPPCQEFSWMAMPWSRGKQVARALRGEDEFPDGYRGSRTIAELTALFDACFRIQREASEAAGKHIPMIVENVRGAQKWVGPARWNYGSFYLYGDVPALMPMAAAAVKVPSVSGKRTDPGNGTRFTSRDCGIESGIKAPGMNWSDQSKRGQDFTRLAGKHAADSGTKNAGAGTWFEGGAGNARDNAVKDKMLGNAGPARFASGSKARKEASAMIAKIPTPLSRWIAKCYYPTAGVTP